MTKWSITLLAALLLAPVAGCTPDDAGPPTSRLEFRIAPAAPHSRPEARPISDDDYRMYTEALCADGPDAASLADKSKRWFPANGTAGDYASVVTGTFAGQLYVLLETEDDNTRLQKSGPEAWSLKRVGPASDDMGRPVVRFEFDERGAAYFSELTGSHTGQFMAMLLDDRVYSCPRINERISNAGIISGNFSTEEVRKLVRSLGGR